MEETGTGPEPGGGVITCTVGWLVGSTALMVLFAWRALPDESSELGAYHDPNAAVAPIAGLFGWIVGGILGACLALAIAHKANIVGTGLLLAAVTAVAALPLAFLVALFSAFGAVLVMIPVAVAYGISVPPVARVTVNARARRRAPVDRRMAALPPPPSASPWPSSPPWGPDTSAGPHT